MSVDPAAVALGAVACGAAGLLVPALVRRIPEHASGGKDDSVPSYAAVAAEPRLPVVAGVTSATAGALVGAGVGLAWPLLYLLPLVPLGVALAVVDLRTRLLPTAVVWPTFAMVAVLTAATAWLAGDADALLRGWAGAALVFAVFYALWWIHPPGMGFGDVRLSAVLGLALGYLGWPELLVGVYGAFLAFALPGLVVALLRRDRTVLRVAYPFGPFLLAGALAGVVVGEPVWSRLVGG
ncbi:prepilin peptidase [Nocardioides sp.]|uniref:prepilin peptidase n=1 Tax=Nocardioides sp. TaxID=35761 RepID=UPI003782E9BB